MTDPVEKKRSFSNDDVADEVLDLRPECMYGAQCYRKNPLHFQQFRHAHLEVKQVKRVKSISQTLAAQLVRVASNTASFPSILPDDVLEVLCLYLDVRDLARLMQVSKTCRKVGRYVLRLDFSLYPFQLSSVGVVGLLLACNNAEFVSMANVTCPLDDAIKHLPLLPRLRALDLSRCAVSIASLRVLSLCTALQTLVCANSGMNENAVAEFAMVPQLTELDLSYSNRFNDISLGHAAHATKLQVLRLAGLTHITATGIKRLAPLAGLETLQLSNCYYLNDLAIGFLAPFTQLRSLDVSEVAGFGPSAINLLATLPLASSLTTLNVSSCSLLTADALAAALPCFSALTTLYARKIAGVTAQFDADLRARGIAADTGLVPAVPPAPLTLSAMGLHRSRDPMKMLCMFCDSSSDDESYSGVSGEYFEGSFYGSDPEGSVSTTASDLSGADDDGCGDDDNDDETDAEDDDDDSAASEGDGDEAGNGNDEENVSKD